MIEGRLLHKVARILIERARNREPLLLSLPRLEECSFFMETASACDLSPNCSFRPLFESGNTALYCS